MTDEKQPQEEAKASESTDVEYLEYRGDEQYGTEFLTSHTIRPVDAEVAGWVTKLTKPIEFTKRPAGRYKGRMLVPLSELPEGVTEELSGDSAFRVVTLKG